MGSMGSYAPMIMSMAQQGMSAAGQVSQSNAAQDAQAEQINQQNQMVWLQHEQKAREQRDLLKRQAASARAALAAGGGGVGSGGSAAALLAGLTRQTEQAIADDHGYLSLRQQYSQPKATKPDRAASILQMGSQMMSAMRPNSY